MNRADDTPQDTLPRYKRYGIECIETGDIYESPSQLSVVLNVHKSTISNHLAGRTPNVAGLTYRKIKRPPSSPMMKKIKRLEAFLTVIGRETTDERVKLLVDKALNNT